LLRSPQNVDAYQGLAILYGMMEDWDRSFEYIDKVLALRPSSLATLRLKGEILVQLGHYQEGLDLLLELPADEVAGAIWISKAYQGLQQSEAAESSLREGLEIDPKSRWLRLYLANQVASNGKLGEAEGLYQSIIAESPYFHLAFYNYGKLLIDRGETERARGLLERAALLAPQHQPTRIALRHLANLGAPPSPSQSATGDTP
jgi:tetratricopeptide (TPR) repeat protein